MSKNNQKEAFADPKRAKPTPPKKAKKIQRET